MSRSNPQDHLANPTSRWFEWNGEKGNVRYYDKEAKRNIELELPLAFLLLDEVATVRGWHDASGSGIFANEVRDTTQELFVVKSFKGGTIAEGKYRDIKPVVNAAGGTFVANCYMAFKDGKNYALGSIRWKGAALAAWMEFRKVHRSGLYTKAIRISEYAEGKKGRVTFRVPVFSLVDITPDADAQAKKLDGELQAFLSAYMKRNKRDQAEASAPRHVPDEDVMPYPPAAMADVTDDDIPF